MQLDKGSQPKLYSGLKNKSWKEHLTTINLLITNDPNRKITNFITINHTPFCEPRYNFLRLSRKSQKKIDPKISREERL